MDDPEPGAPLVRLPEPLDRHVRLGPFPSARDALKFVSYAAAGAVLAPFATPFAWVPVLLVGLVVSVWRPDGEAIDERAARIVLFQLQARHERRVTRRAVGARAPGLTVRLRSGATASVVRTGGTPLAYRPPADLALLFDGFRGLLRAQEGSLFVRATTVPLAGHRVLPSPGEGSGGDGAARRGYAELVTVLCHRRRSRRVDLALTSYARGPDAERRLAERARALEGHLLGLGLRAAALAGRSLEAAVGEFGWEVREVP
jgi:hypothetical protein